MLPPDVPPRELQVREYLAAALLPAFHLLPVFGYPYRLVAVLDAEFPRQVVAGYRKTLPLPLARRGGDGYQHRVFPPFLKPGMEQGKRKDLRHQFPAMPAFLETEYQVAHPLLVFVLLLHPRGMVVVQVMARTAVNHALPLERGLVGVEVLPLAALERIFQQFTVHSVALA